MLTIERGTHKSRGGNPPILFTKLCPFFDLEFSKCSLISSYYCVVKTAFDIQVNGKRGPGRPKMTWKQLTERDRREWKLSAIDLHDRDIWRSCVRSAMRAASQLPGRGPTVVDMVLISAR